MFEEASIAGDNASQAHASARSPGPAMRIAYLGAADLGGARLRDSVDILVPTDTANLSATYRVGQGRDRTTFLRAPLVSVVPPALPHTLADRPGTNTLVLSIAAPFFHQVARALGGDDTALVEPHATADPLIREVGDAAERDVRARRLPDARYMESLAMVLAVHVARKYAVLRSTTAAALGGLAPHKLRCVHNHICEHLGETIRVEQLAAAVQLSPFHFARMFKQSTGQSPHLYVLMQRVERAKALLTGTDTALIDVAANVGFRTQGHFTGVFHRYAGFTPRAFRLQARETVACDAPIACALDRTKAPAG
ncbi:helix-turn-helix transcriptional regulator [Aquincola tertiaricarbonis]|uniref:helix-turn-helix transcriptional regulator n=1 Tax=Aquincola tertiaricarbonis TaxID=391953 RepID=UPI000AF4149C|nr:AraC family transcriptional regulator [Aquincola tertiaricarbonis]